MLWCFSELSGCPRYFREPHWQRGSLTALGFIIIQYFVSVTLLIIFIVMMTSSNGNIFRVTGPLSGPGEFPTQRPVTRSLDVFFDLHLNKRLSKQPWGWWFETLSWSLWRHCNVCDVCNIAVPNNPFVRKKVFCLCKRQWVHHCDLSDLSSSTLHSKFCVMSFCCICVCLNHRLKGLDKLIWYVTYVCLFHICWFRKLVPANDFCVLWNAIHDCIRTQ